MISDIFNQKREKELKYLLVAIEKKGINILVKPIIDNPIDIKDVNNFDDEITNGVEIINKNKFQIKETFGDIFQTKALFIDNEFVFGYDTLDNEMIDNPSCFIRNDIELKEGSIIMIDDIISYKIKNISKKGYSKVKKYELVRL